MKRKLLWIEDQLESDMVNHRSSVLLDGTFGIDGANTATAACNLLQTKQYDLLLVDIRIEAGLDENWQSFYSDHGRQKDRARLGLQILRALILKPTNLPQIHLAPGFSINPAMIGVVSIEPWSELADDLTELGISNYLGKGSEVRPSHVADFVRRIAAGLQ